MSNGDSGFAASFFQPRSSRGWRALLPRLRAERRRPVRVAGGPGARRLEEVG